MSVPRLGGSQESAANPRASSSRDPQLLFFGGVMNLVWIAGITVFVLLEKVRPAGMVGARAAGIAMMGTGAVVLVTWAVGAS